MEKRCLLVAPIIHTQGTGYAQTCDSVQTCTPEVGTWRCHTKFFTAFKTLATATQAGGRQGAQHSIMRPAPSTFNASGIKKALRTSCVGLRGLGVVEVVGSNPVTPTNISKRLSTLWGEPFFS